MAKITSKGQITLPKKIRDALGLDPGSQVDFEVEQGKVVLRKRVPTAALERWRGYLRGKVGGRTTDELIEEMRGGVDGVENENGPR